VLGREPLHIHPDDAAFYGIAEGALVEVYNDRGRALAGARYNPALMRGVLRLSTGAWADAQGDLDRHGNPNVLTPDVGASGLSQGCSAHSCLVAVRAWKGEAPKMRAFEPPSFSVETPAQ